MLLLSRYLRELVKHSVNIFSLVSLILALSAFFLLWLSDGNDIVNAIIFTSAAILSILAAGFYAWKEIVESYPTSANLSVEYKSCTFHSTGTRDGVPISPMQFRVNLDAINRGQESVVLTDIKIVKFNLNNKLFENAPSKTELLLLNPPHGNNQISCPYIINGRQHIPNLEYRISVKMQALKPIEFARNLGEFQDYEIELEYSFENMDRVINSRTISVLGSFKEYRERCIKEWSNNKQQHELAVEALRALEVIE